MKNITNSIFVLGLCFALVASIFAFNTPAPNYEHLTFTTIESIVPGGTGRSRLLIDGGNGNMDEQKIKNLYSIVGIKMANIFDNDQSVSEKLNDLSEEGWELSFVSTGVQSPSDNGGGIYCTRYILRREK